MVMSRTILRVSFALALLPTGLSAQRYTGHDHAVFHRAPQPPSSTVKHQSQPSVGTKASPKTAPGNAASQPASHTTTSPSRPELDLNQNSAQTPVDNTPRF